MYKRYYLYRYMYKKYTHNQIHVKYHYIRNFSCTVFINIYCRYLWKVVCPIPPPPPPPFLNTFYFYCATEFLHQYAYFIFQWPSCRHIVYCMWLMFSTVTSFCGRNLKSCCIVQLNWISCDTKSPNRTCSTTSCNTYGSFLLVSFKFY